jgi:2-methylcitrate dehydratase PrpD
MKETITFAERYLDLPYDKLTPRSIEMAKQCMIDYLGCTYAALSYDSSCIARDYAVQNYGKGPCTVIGSSEKLVPAGACFTNGTTGHAADLDDCMNEGGGHPGVIIIPVALAMAEYAALSGKELLRCIIIGYDTFAKVGKASNYQSLFDRGFHPTALLGMFGAAMTAARALDLNLDETANALGIVGSFVAGNLECYADGSYTKRLHAGSASSAGVTAALLAKNGYTGPKSILEGSRGFFHAYCKDARPELINSGDFRTLEIEKVSFKPHACCRFNQAGIDAMLALLAEYGLEHREIASIRVELARTCYEIVGQPEEVKFHPKNAVDCQFSAPYSIAIAAIEKRAFLDEYTNQSASRQDVAELLKKITVLHNPELDRFFPESFPTRITIGTKSGKSYSKEVRYPKGDPENPLIETEVVEKFGRAVAKSGLSNARQKEILEAILGLEEAGDVKRFSGLLSGL